jgi:hypothetical protein
MKMEPHHAPKNQMIALYRSGSITFWKPIKIPFWATWFGAPLRNGIAKRKAIKKQPPGSTFLHLATNITQFLN